ncbi:MAG: VUT family protein, partial [Paludibacter sp.]|nr:VUT family protein [Paludibacter sp.]
NTLRITLASFVAFLFGSFVNAYVMSKMKILQHGRGFSLRAIVSTLAGEGIDSLVFFSIAFSGILPIKTLIILILTQIGMKTSYEIIVLPITTQLVKFVKKREKENVFDYDISYNPFK